MYAGARLNGTASGTTLFDGAAAGLSLSSPEQSWGTLVCGLDIGGTCVHSLVQK